MQFTRRKERFLSIISQNFGIFFCYCRNFAYLYTTRTKELRTIHRCTTYQRFVDKTKPLHASQRQDPSDPSLFTLRCYPTDDLMYAILSHGRKLSVLAPEDFRRRIIEEIEGMKEGYEG